MNTPNDGGPAFPFHIQHPNGDEWKETGMTLRDWFAGKALQGLLIRGALGTHAIPAVLYAFDAYALADAMLAQRANSKCASP